MLQSVISACNSVEFLDYFQSIYPTNFLPAKFGSLTSRGGAPTQSWGVGSMTVERGEGVPTPSGVGGGVPTLAVE